MESKMIMSVLMVVAMVQVAVGCPYCPKPPAAPTPKTPAPATPSIPTPTTPKTPAPATPSIPTPTTPKPPAPATPSIPTPTTPMPTPTPPAATPPTGDFCPIDALKLGACLDVLGGLVHVGLGDSSVNQCCPVLKGIAEVEAALCLCTVIKANLLNLDIYVPLALELLASCQKTPPKGFTCPK